MRTSTRSAIVGLNRGRDLLPGKQALLIKTRRSEADQMQESPGVDSRRGSQAAFASGLGG
jgi:hypothetical protein